MLLTGLPGSPNTIMALLLLEASIVAYVKGFPGFILTCKAAKAGYGLMRT